MLSFVLVRKVDRGFEVRNIQVHGLVPKEHEAREKLDHGHSEEITFYTKKT